MNWTTIIFFTFVLLVSQILATGIASYIVFANTSLGGETVEFYALNYAASFIVSTAVLSWCSSKQQDRVLLQICLVAFSSLLIGNVISYLLIQESMPLALYFIDIVFTLFVVAIALKIGYFWRFKRCSAYT